MCSSGGKVAADDQALQDANVKAQQVATQNAALTFSQQQSVLGNLKAKFDYMASNPMGFSSSALHAAKTSINDTVARAASRAIGAASAFAARHGSADIGGGVTGQVAGEIASEAAQSKSQQLGSLTQQNEEMKRQNMLTGLSGLNQVGSELAGSTATSLGNATSSSNAGVGAGSGVLAAQQAGWDHFAGVLGGISGLVKAGTGMAGLMMPGKIPGASAYSAG